MRGFLDMIRTRRSTLPPSVLPDISPARVEIAPAAFGGVHSESLAVGADGDDGLISPHVGKMSGRTEGRAKGRGLRPVGRLA
jgi:hypothetical protein